MQHSHHKNSCQEMLSSVLRHCNHHHLLFWLHDSLYKQCLQNCPWLVFFLLFCWLIVCLEELFVVSQCVLCAVFVWTHSGISPLLLSLVQTVLSAVQGGSSWCVIEWEILIGLHGSCDCGTHGELSLLCTSDTGELVTGGRRGEEENKEDKGESGVIIIRWESRKAETEHEN